MQWVTQYMATLYDADGERFDSRSSGLATKINPVHTGSDKPCIYIAREHCMCMQMVSSMCVLAVELAQRLF